MCRRRPRSSTGWPFPPGRSAPESWARRCFWRSPPSRRILSHGPRAVRAGAVPLPARARSAAGREHQPAAGHRGASADQPRPHVGARHQPHLRHLPQPDGPDRLRPGEVRCHRRAQRKSSRLQFSTSPRREANAAGKTVDLDIDTDGNRGRHPGLAVFFARGTGRAAGQERRSARSAW